MTETTVTETKYTDSDGTERTQYRTTVPKQMAEALGLGGEKVEWRIEQGQRLSIGKADK